jgi:3-deoxy-D-manno-octulosonate 8-phosphate phosphatase (KDO 8-P phosphatase)
MSKARAKKIKLILLDVDGVMTDGSIWLFPAPAGVQAGAAPPQAGKVAGGGGFGFHSQTMIEAKGFNAHDGTAISLAHLAGLKVGLITKRISDTVAIRARDLKLDHVHQGIQDKLTVFREILKEEGLSPDEAAYVGDDIIDLPVMRHCGLAIAVPNGRDEVKRAAHLVTEHAGGHGAVRDAIEFILKAQGQWERVVEEYVKERSPEEESKRQMKKEEVRMKNGKRRT